MTSFKGSDTSRLEFHGPLDGGFLGVAGQNIESEFSSLDELARRRLLDALLELSHNVVQHGSHPRHRAQIVVDSDDRGTYVEVSSTGWKADLENVKAYVERIRTLSDEEIEEEELRVSMANLGTNRGGLGLLQVARRAKWSDIGRMVFVTAESEAGECNLRIRTYVC